MTVKELSTLSDFFKALGDPTRLKILSLLASSGMLCVNGIASRMKITQPAVSQHLKILKHAGILDSSKEGVYVHYRINKKEVEGLLNNIKNLLRSNADDRECDTCP